jgi:hypothetical protein
MQEKRASPRFQVDLNVRWESLKSHGRGAISDLSSSGCFVLTGGDVTAGELVRLQISSRDRLADVWGLIVYAISEMGFALRFVFADAAEGEALKKRIIDL